MKRRASAIILALLASFIVPIMIGNVYASGCASACQVTVNSNVPTADGTIWIKIDNGTGTYCSGNPCTLALPQSSPPTFNFPNNTIHTINVLNSTFTGPSTQGHYVWKEWDNYYGNPAQTKWTSNPKLVIGPILFNYTGPAGFTAVFDKQYSATLSFTDVKGNPLSPAPVSLTMQGRASGTTTITGYSGQYISSDLYTVTSALWEGTSILANSTETLDLTNGPAAATISLRAYPATVLIVDNNNNPVSGANVTITFVNGTITSKTYVSGSNGRVNLGDIPDPGSYGVTVHYQNQVYGPYSETAVNNPTTTIKVSASAPATTTTTAIVLLAIFGIAFFLILLAIRVRKPSTPPTIS